MLHRRMRSAPTDQEATTPRPRHQGDADVRSGHLVPLAPPAVGCGDRRDSSAWASSSTVISTPPSWAARARPTDATSASSTVSPNQRCSPEPTHRPFLPLHRVTPSQPARATDSSSDDEPVRTAPGRVPLQQTSASSRTGIPIPFQVNVRTSRNHRSVKEFRVPPKALTPTRPDSAKHERLPAYHRAELALRRLDSCGRNADAPGPTSAAHRAPPSATSPPKPSPDSSPQSSPNPAAGGTAPDLGGSGSGAWQLVPETPPTPTPWRYWCPALSPSDSSSTSSRP